MEKIEKEITVTRYVAFDGTEFITEAECLNYEGSTFGRLLHELGESMLYTTTKDRNCKILTVYPRSRHDIYVLSQIFKLADMDNPCGELYGHLVLLQVRLQCNTVLSVEGCNLEDYIKEMSNGMFAVVSAADRKKEMSEK